MAYAGPPTFVPAADGGPSPGGADAKGGPGGGVRRTAPARHTRRAGRAFGRLHHPAPPMRPVLLAALAAVLALPAAAQPVLPDSADAYVSPLFGIASIGSQGTSWVAGLDAGRRVGALDVGVRALVGDVTYGEGGAYAAAGPTVGITRRLPGGVEADARALGLVTFADPGGAGGFGFRAVQGTAQATVGRPVRLVGSLRLVPTVGAYGTACATSGLDAAPGARCAEAGALVGADLRFRLLGADVSLPAVAGIPLVGNDDAGRVGAFDLVPAPISAGLRIQF